MTVEQELPLQRPLWHCKCGTADINIGATSAKWPRQSHLRQDPAHIRAENLCVGGGCGWFEGGLVGSQEGKGGRGWIPVAAALAGVTPLFSRHNMSLASPRTYNSKIVGTGQRKCIKVQNIFTYFSQDIQSSSPTECHAMVEVGLGSRQCSAQRIGLLCFPLRHQCSCTNEPFTFLSDGGTVVELLFPYCGASLCYPNGSSQICANH